MEWNNAKGASLKRRDHFLRGEESKFVKRFTTQKRKKCGVKGEGGVEKSVNLLTSFMDGPKLHFGVMGMTPAYPHAICPTSKTKVGQLLRIAEFCF